MRRNKKLFASGFSQFQAKQGSERKRSRSVARYFFNEINPLEGRVLLTAITINSQADLATYFHSSTNSYSIDAGHDSVTIAPNIIINTSSATGQAGGITISGKSVSIGNNVQILANGATDAQDGSITISASNVMKGFNINAVNQAEDLVRWWLQDQSATITVGQGVTIKGGAVNLSTESGNEFKASWVSNLIVQPLSAILLEAYHKPDWFTLPVTVQVWQPQSTISFAGGSGIYSSGNVTVTSDATVNAVGKAIWNTLKYGTHIGSGHFLDGDTTGPLTKPFGRLGLALGDFYTDANATISLNSNATIKAAGEVEMKTTVDNVVELESEAIKNLGITQTNPNAISLAFGFTQLKTTSVIDLQPNSLIEAEGNVVIEAEATDENAVAGLAAAYRDGTFTAGGAFAYSDSNVQVFVNGTVTSGVTPTEHEDLSPVLFNPAFTVDFTDNTLNFGIPVQYETGQELVFDSADGSTIPGLKPGSNYFAIVNSAYPDRLQLALSKSDALSGTAIRFGTGYPTLSVGSNTIPVSVIDSAVSNAILFGYNTLPDGTPVFINGQTVTYAPLTGQFIGTSDSSGNYAGPLAAGQYTVQIVPSPEPDYFPLAIQLYDMNQNLVILNTYSQFVTSDGTAYLVSSFDTSSSQVDFNFSQPPSSDNETSFLPVPTQIVSLTNGQAITFVSGLGCQVGNLVNGQTYYAVVDPTTPGVIRLATTFAQSMAANPAVQDAIPQLKTVGNQLAIGGFVDSFTKSNEVSSLQPQSDDSYSLYNNASGGTFQLTINGPEGSATTSDLPYNIDAAGLQSAMNAINGIVATVSGLGTQTSPWQIAIQFQFNIGNVQPGTGLVFSNNPNLADGTAVQYLGIAGKPVGGLTDGAVYYAYNTTNPNFDSKFPQYVLNMKTTASTSAPDIDLVLQQTMTDDNGLNYNFVASNAAENQVVLRLNQTVPINAVDSSSLTGGSAGFQALSSGGVQYFSFATSGTFTFSVTDSSGNVQTTGDIAYNAPSADVSAALNSLSGVSVQVTGLGTISSPWTIVGLVNQAISDDSSALKNEGFATSLLSNTLSDGVQQIWTNATGGTFTISLNQNGQTLTTSPITFNATPAQVQAALNALPRIKAVVSGSGTATNPWQFTAVYQSIKTGDTLIFNDCWNSYNNGMLDGQPYYAVVSKDQYSPQDLIVSFAATYADAVSSDPQLISMQNYLLLSTNQTGVMTGSPMGLDEVHGEVAGVTIKAILEASDSVTFTSNVGLFPMLGYYTAGAWAGHHSYKNTEGGYLSAIEKHIQDVLPESYLSNEDRLFGFTGSPIDKTSILQTSFAIALLVSKNNVNVNVGSTAVIETSGVVTISSDINHVLHTQADAGVARTTMAKTATGEDKPNAALAVALDLAFVDNTSMAVVQSNAQVTGGEGVDIDSAISYPFAWKETNISALKNANGSLSKKQKAADGTALAENIVKDALFKNAFGVSNWLFNHSVNTDVMQPDNSVLDWTISASVSSINIKNTNLAQICDGARINQSQNVHAGSNQSVSVLADTDISQLSVTGQMVLGLNLGWLYYSKKADGGWSKNYNYMLFLNQGKNAIGGSINLTAMDNSTEALIGGQNPEVFVNMPENQSQSPKGPMELNYGNGGLIVEAATDNEYISIAQSGGIASGFGFQASIAVTAIDTQNTTAAVIATANPPVIQNNTGTNGNITIKSSDSTVLTPSSGGLLIGKSINLGFSSSEAILNRNVSAYIGQNSANSAADQSTWVGIHSAGEIVIDACATGKIIPVSLAGSVVTRPSDAKGDEIKYKDEEFRWGIGVSGDYSEANIVDNVSAYLNGVSLTGHENEQQLEISSLNSTRLNVSTGAAALQFEESGRSSVGFAGSASYSNYVSNVTVLINNSNITDFSISLDAQNKKTVGTFAAGLSGSIVGKVGIDVAGSVAINHVKNDTVAEIANTTGSNLGTLDVEAVEKDDIWAAAGTITVVTSIGSGIENPDSVKTKVGFGFGFAQNLLDSTTHAIISDSNLTQTAGELNLASEQASRSFVLSAGAVFEVGKGAGITPYGMVALNQYTNADVQAVVQNSQITNLSTGSSIGMLVASQLIPIMITAAGDLGLSIGSKEGSGSQVNLGAGVSVTEVSIVGNSVASVSDSTITLDQGDLVIKAYTGQAANATNLNNTLNNLNLPPGNYNLYSLAIAGGLTTAFAPVGALAVGVDGVGAGIGSSTSINTLANVSNSSEINLLGQKGSGGSLTVEALENLSVYDDAGGASVSIQLSSASSFGVVVGIGAGVHNSTNNAVASLTNSNVTTAANLTLSADVTSNVNVIGFGVALDVTSATEGLAVGGSASSATAKIVSENTISASITGGLFTTSGMLNLTAEDNSVYRTVVGSGSLSVGWGSTGSFALAAGSSVSRIEPSHTITAFIGSTDANSKTITTVIAGGPVNVQAINKQQLSAQTIAVASSVAIGASISGSGAAAGAGARIISKNTVKAGVLYGANLTSNLAFGSNAVSVKAIDNANIVTTVGSGALAITISPIPVGVSIGISISEITNNDLLIASLEGGTITTQGGDVLVEATGNNTQSSLSVATSATDGLGLAGAGGNSNIYDNSNVTASIDSGASIVTGNATTGYGSLSVLANTSENVEAQMFGGSVDLGIGSIGVFMSNATRSGSTVANLVTNGTISVGNLAVKATTNQTITSEGMSVTVGGLAGTGETHRLGINENVHTNVNGSGNTWHVSGNLSIGSSSTNNATAQTSGAGDGQQGVNIGLLGVGFYKVDSAVNPVVSTSITNANLVVTGSSSMGTIVNFDNSATARSGSGSIVGGDAARAITDNSPTISFNTNNMTLSAVSATFLARNSGTYTTNADSVYATAVGGSAARAYNTSNPNLTLNLGSNTSITADGSVIVKAENDMTGMGDATNMNGKTGGIMARVGGGGIVGGFGGTSVSCMTSNSAVSLGNGVSILTKATGGKILIGSSQGWNTNQLTYMHDSSAIGGAGVQSCLTSCLTNNIALGNNVTLSAPAGSVAVGTSINSQTTADDYSYTFSIFGGSTNTAQNKQTSCQTVSIGQNSVLSAGGTISVIAGTDPVSQQSTLQDTYAIVTAQFKGLGGNAGADANATSNSNFNVTVGSGSQIISDRDVNLGAIPGINNAQWYASHSYDKNHGGTDSGSDGATQTSCVTINGNVVAGNTHQVDINIPQSGDTATVNGQAVNLAASNGVLTTVVPQANSAFLPFQASYNPNYNATSLLNGLDQTSKAILQKSISTSPVQAITLANLAATGGQVVIHANTSLTGTGTISAFSPNITVNNNSPAYLILDGVGIPNTLNMGKITVVGSGGASPGLKLNQQLAKPSITINENFKGVVGTGTTSGPAIAITGPIVNTGGTVSIFNANGALVQDASINAAAVSISTPNSATIVNMPNQYKGIGGSITDYWMNTYPTLNLVQNSGFESPSLGTGSSAYQYNPTGAGWTFTASTSNSTDPGYAGSGLAGNDSAFTSSNPNAPQGTQVAFLQGHGTITQSISNLVAGQQYTLSFLAAQRSGYFSSSQYQQVTVTMGSTTLVSSLEPNSTSYQQYTYTFTPTTSGTQTLTFTGIRPTNQDETIFLDQVTISPSPSVVTPGLNAYVYQYTANLAATTAANVLYLQQSGATNSTAFSEWLYNTSQISINNFINTNISATNLGSNYPSGIKSGTPGSKSNWHATENGQGIIFFGSEIPYIWATGPISFAPGSASNLTGSCQTGYQDSYSNAQYWSVAASGNPASGNLNIAQGTGPMNGDSTGLGIFPVVPSNFPTSATISNPQNATLGNGITAGQLDITALYIDINAPVNLGVYNAGFQANLTAALGDYIQSQVAGNASLACVQIPTSYLGGSNTSLSAYYDVQANQIVLNPVAINAGVVSAIFKGGIISTTNQGKITVTSNPGQNLIDNQSGYPLVIQGISAAETKLAGIVQFDDTLTNISTAYVYRGNSQVEKYQGPLGPQQGANLSQLKLVGNSSGTSATFSPAANLAYQWEQAAVISRSLSFTRNGDYYTLNTSANPNWSWGPLDGYTAPANYVSANNPFKQGYLQPLTDGDVLWNESASGEVVTLSAPISDYTEQILANITQSETATTIFDNIYSGQYSWNYGCGTQWTWTYPLEILMMIKNQVPACNPISIDFSGVQYGSLGINSGSSLALDGNIQFPGNVNLSSGGSITQVSGAVIAANKLTGLTATGAIGNATSPVNLNIGTGNISAQAGTGLYLSSGQNLTLGTLAATDGPVQLQSGGSIFACGTLTNVSGTEIKLLAPAGSIGSQAQPIAIQTKTTPLPTGSVTGGLFTASATNAIFVTQATGDLRIASVKTTSPMGVVSINNAQGNITDGNIPDAFGLNNSSLSPALVGRVIDSMRLNSQNNVNTTIAAFEGSVDASYLQYWTALQNGSVANGSLTLTATGVQYYQPNANQYYANSANQTSNATVAQVNSYANMLYDNAINVFENNMAYGPGWASLPEFQAYNANYTFTASNATISALSYRAINIGNDFALLSLDALSSQSSTVLGNTTAPAISTTVLDLKAGGSIGLTLDPVEIDLDSIQSGNLTSNEKALLALASTAGELQMVGTNAAGQKIYYSYGSEPANVTATGVVVRIEKPLFVDVASNGLTMVQAKGSINLSGTSGSLNVLGASSNRDIRLTNQGDITQGQLQASITTPGWSLAGNGTLGYSGNGWSWSASCLTLTSNSLSNVTAGGNLRLISGGDIGTIVNPLEIQVGKAVSAYASGSLALNQPTGDLQLSDVKAGPQGTVQINAGGSILNRDETKYITKNILNGFGGWVQANQTSAPSQVPTNLQLSDGMTNCATAWWYQQQLAIPTNGCITVQFDYQAGGSRQADGITLAMQTVGTSALGGVGGSLGYNGITGPLAAYQINLYNGHIQGSNFVTSNTTGNYLSTGSVSFNSGDTISVTLVYDADANTVTESLKDLSSNETFQRVYSSINLASVIGSLAYIGFTGGDGGATSIQNVSNFTLSRTSQISTASSPLKGTFTGFGGNGTGWTTKSSANGTSSISDNVLTLSQSQPPVGSISSASAMYGTPLTIENSFISSFLYQSQSTGSTTYFVINSAEELGVVANPTAINPSGPTTVGLQINTPSASPWQQSVGLLYNGVLLDVQVPRGINFASGDAIQVVITYNNSQKAITVALTDTLTQQSYSFVANNIDMLKALGSTQGQIGFFATGNGQPASQTISGFSFAYGSPTIQGQSVALTSGGAIGSPTNPILTLVSGNISATAPEGVYLLETSGNMYVQSVDSSGNVSLAAPAGSIVNTANGSVQSSSLRAANPGIHTASIHTAGIRADQLQLMALKQLGSTVNPLVTRVNSITACNTLGNIVLNNSGLLNIGDGSANNGLKSSGAVQVSSDLGIHVNSSVLAAGDIQLRTTGNYLAGSSIQVNTGAVIESKLGGIHLFGGEGVILAAGATLQSLALAGQSVVEFNSNPVAGGDTISPAIESHGRIIADTIRFNSSNFSTALYLALDGIHGHSNTPTVEFNAGSQFDTLTLDNQHDNTAQAITIADGIIQSASQKLVLNAIDSVILELGQGNDQVKIGTNLPLDQFQIFTNGGDDSVETTLAPSTAIHQLIDTGTGSDNLRIDAAGQNAWASTGLLQSWDHTIQHNATETITLKSATTLNAVPALNFVKNPATGSIDASNRQYIDAAFQQVLNRSATASELDRWAGMLDRRVITRLQLATKLTNSDEARLLRVNAWYLNYFGRPATQVESKQALRRIHSGQSETRILSGILSSSEFFGRTQSLASTGFSRDRFITSLYKLAIDPSGTPTPALQHFLNRLYQTRGRTAVVMNILQSSPATQNQAEALSILINQAPATRSVQPIRLGQNHPKGLQAILLSRK